MCSCEHYESIKKSQFMGKEMPHAVKSCLEWKKKQVSFLLSMVCNTIPNSLYEKTIFCLFMSLRKVESVPKYFVKSLKLDS